MNNTTRYSVLRRYWPLLVLFWLHLASGTAQAQSGPYGNEWIVPGQQYYKIKITQDGIYRLDYQYLTQTGFGNGINPARLQLWRRGREVAVYQSGASNTFDSSTALEFYGQRNDGQLDRDLYKNAADQAHQYYSFYTDTAAYFLTYGTASGKRMVESSSIGGSTPHPWRLYTGKVVETYAFVQNTHDSGDTFLPWLDKSEGFFSLNIADQAGESIDSLRAVLPTGPAPAPQLEVQFLGGTNVSHQAETRVRDLSVSGTGYRSLGFATFNQYDITTKRFTLRRSDISSAAGAGRLQLLFVGSGIGTGSTADAFRVSYMRVVVPQANRWFARSRQLFFQNDSTLGGPATFEVDSIPAAVYGYDVTNPWAVQRIAPATAQTLGPLGRRFVFPSATSAQTRRLMLGGAQPYVPTPARRIYFRTLSPAKVTFAIITHPQLYRSASDPATFNAPREYAAYRASAAGGRFDTLIVTAPQLYDQFHYGERSWLALRHFSLWLAAAAPANPNRYLMLLGKGLIPEEILCSRCGGTLTGNLSRTRGESGLDLVPCSSRSTSDNLLTADFQHDDFTAKLHTGRITAVNSGQIMAYLNKVRTHDALGPAPWRKNVLHLIGAKPINNEEQEFTNYLNREKARIERPLLGGSVTTKIVATPLPVKVDISAQLNAGLSLIDYFGHGQNNIFLLDFAAPSTAPTYNNPGKYPVLILNGCAGNSTCVSTYTVVEDYLFAEQKGAIGSLGESGFSYPYPLSEALDSLHRLMFNDPNWYGRPITVIHDEAVRRLQNSSLFMDDIGREQLLATTWQGDPTIALYSPALPDLVASAATLSITRSPGQPPVTATSSNFVLNVGVSNPGKITRDPIEIQVTRTGSPAKNYTVRQSWQADTTYALTIPNDFPGIGGSNTFRVVLDPNNKIAESNESNNAAQIDFTFLTGGLAVLNPTEFAIVSTATPHLTVQSNNPAETSRAYEFELDTDPNFASTLKKTTIITAGVVAEWQPAALPTTVAGRDSVVWYWRARFQTPAPGEDGSWVTSSFRVIPSSPTGWSQSDAGQFRRDALTGVAVSGLPTNWTFTPERIPLVLRTAGGGPPRSTAQFNNVLGGGIYLQSAGLPVVANCGVQSPNLLIAVYDGVTLRPLVMPGTYQRCGQAPNYSYYFSAATTASIADSLDNLNYSATRQQQLDAFLTAIPNNAYVAVISTNRLRYSLLPAALKTRLKTLLGSQLITTLADGEPLALVGQKLTAATGRLLHEIGPDRTSTTLAYNQLIELADTLLRAGSSGHVVSTLIGPSQQWNNLYTSIRASNNSGQYTLKVVGVSATGSETTVLPNVPVLRNGTLYTQPLTNVSASTYPYLRLDLTLSDTARVVPQLRQWLVTSRGLPEGVVQRDAVPASTYTAAALLAQATSGNATVSFPVKFKNVSNETFSGPLSTRVQVRDGSNKVVAGPVFVSTPAPLPGETATVNASINVAGHYGDLTIEVVVNPRLQPEQNYANNELILPTFKVINNNVPPTLDVAIDNRHILNGELVSSTPTIVVQLNDEDQILHVRNVNAFTLTLQRHGQSSPTLVPLTGNDISFTVDSTRGSRARLTYEPGKGGPLPDGKYTLRVQGRDPNNAAAAVQEVQLSFEVVREATISNLYPYPNPVIGKARFVFTVTGHELPRNMKIQIMSLTGRVVREIFMDELGPLHIGNNITDYAWDGTDSYGDRLANGTYLYRVAYDDNVGFKHRDTAGDKAFKNDWGKLVLLR